MSDILEKVAIAIIGGVVGAVLFKKLGEKDLRHKEENFDDKIKEADKRIAEADKKIQIAKDSIKSYSDLASALIDDLSHEVDTAVKSVYEREAKESFRRKLDDYDYKSIAIKECKDSMLKITREELRSIIRYEFGPQISDILELEVKKYFNDNIQRTVQTNIDSEYIMRTAKLFIREEVVNILEDRADKALDDCNIEDIVEDYLKERSIKLESIIKKTVTKLISEKVDDLDLDVDDEEKNGIHITFR